MCTLILDWKPRSLLLLGNRDERLDRPAQGWALRTSARGTRFLAPLDLAAGGTWVGVNQHGLVVALTNHHTGSPPDPARASRGILVQQMFDHSSASAARDDVLCRRARDYNPFHLVVADATSAFLWHSSPTADAPEDLAPGLHVVTESHAHGVGDRGASIRQRFHPSMTASEAHSLLALHAEDPRAAVCVHLGDTYGTRSSLMLALEPGRGTLFVTDQRPCLTPWTDATALLNQLLSA